MSQKKATPKAVFDACEQLTASVEEGETWNRDDVRLLVGGGSYAVIDPLIKAWRKLQPVREVAPSLPSELLIQVAQLLEQQVAGFIEQVEQQDNERELIFSSANEELAANFVKLEQELGSQLELSQQANHDLEAECDRLKSELIVSQQDNHAQAVRLEILESDLQQARQQLESESKRNAELIKRGAEERESLELRLAEQYGQDKEQLKLDYQQQLLQQKQNLTSASQSAENHLMRLLDQSRSELKQANLAAEDKTTLLMEQLSDKEGLLLEQRLKINALESKLYETAELSEKRELDLVADLSRAENKLKEMRLQVQSFQAQSEADGNAQLEAIKESILSLQVQVAEK